VGWFVSSHLSGTGGGTASGTSWYRTSTSEGHFSGSGGGSGGGSSRAVVPLNPAVLPLEFGTPKNNTPP